MDMAFTSDSAQLVTSGLDGTIRFWELNSNAFPRIEGAQGVGFSPNGTQIAITNEDDTSYLWDFEKKKSIRLENSLSVYEFVFSSNGSYLAAIEEEGKEVYVWDTNGNRVTTIENSQDEDRFVGLGFSADGTQLATVTQSEGTEANPDSPMTVRLWDIDDKKEIASFDNVPGGRVREIVFNSDDVKLAIYGSLTGEDRIAQIWDSTDGKMITLKGHKGSVGGLKFALDGTRIITIGAEDGTARLWDTKGNELAVFKGHRGDIYSVELSPDGEHIATAGSDGTMRLWDTKGNELHVFEGHEREVNDIKFSPDGTQLATGGHDGTVRLWDLKGNELARLGSTQNASVWNIEFSSDGDWLTIHREDGTVHC